MKTPKNTHRKSGIYRITCKATRRIYVGSAVDLAARLRCHRFDLLRGRHHNRYLQRAWAKHGPSGFSFRVIEYCAPSLLILREQWHMDRLVCVQPAGFNLNPTARSALGLKRTKEQCEAMRARALGKSPSPETRAKLSKALKLACKGKKIPRSMIEKAALFNRGRPLTPEHRKKIGDAHRGRKRPRGMMKRLADFNRGKKRRPETILKMSASMKLAWKLKQKNE